MFILDSTLSVTVVVVVFSFMSVLSFYREKKIDLLKWKWLDDNTFFKTFDIESVFAYLLKLEMIERWVTLDKARGEKTFRELVGAMKMGSENALEEFKRNNIK